MTNVSSGADSDHAEGIFSGPPMSKMIVYTCRKTGPSGVLSDENSFAHLPHEKVTVQCLEFGTSMN
jgi:hypothetical protein